jgi:hypothetical protein
MALRHTSEWPVIRPEPSVEASRRIQHNDRQTPEYIPASLSHVQGRRSFCDWVHSGPVRVLSPQDPDDRAAALGATFCKSLVAETEMFMDYVRQNRTTKPYAQGHIKYITQQIERPELQESSPAQGEEDGAQQFGR